MSMTALIANHPEQPAAVRVPFAIKRTHAASSQSTGASTSRRRLWDLAPNLHCSIVGTCLTTTELRQIVERAERQEPRRRTDHELHGEAVRLCAVRGELSRELQRTLERRHQGAVKRFERIKAPADLLEQWKQAKRSGDIAGPYWAVLTHRATDQSVVAQVFGDVHMLSHLVGAANRADIRRLAHMEEERDALQLKCWRQQAHLQRVTGERDEARCALEALEGRPRSGFADTKVAEEIAVLKQQVRRLEERLGTETQRRMNGDRERENAERARATAHGQLGDAQHRERELLREIEALEERLTTMLDADGEAEMGPALGGVRVLYVGGRTSKVHELRAYVEAAGGALEFHDGGVEDRRGLLAAMIERCHVAFFPVDCVSHDAVASLKRACGRTGIPYVPLRSASLSSFAGGLRSWSDLAAEAVASP